MSEQDPNEAVETTTQAIGETPISKLFRYSTYIHVGVDADICEAGGQGSCTDPHHFHAWVRLPNQFQHEAIQLKGRAARARVLRALHDPESDARTIVDADVDELRETTSAEKLIEYLVSLNDMTDRLEAMRELEETDEWKHRTQDVMRRRELEAMDPEMRDQSELDQLISEGNRYADGVRERMEQIQTPRRTALGGLDLEQLLGQWREQRMLQEANSAFSAAYARQQWYLCTLRPCAVGHPQDRVFKEPKDLDVAAPEVVDALEAAYRDLEMNLQRQISGNS